MVFIEHVLIICRRCGASQENPGPAQVLGGELALTQKEVQPGQDFMAALQQEAQIPLDPSQVRLLFISGLLMQCQISKITAYLRT